MKLQEKQIKRLFIIAFIAIVFLAFNTNDVKAAPKCCACTHPNVSGGRFCIQDYSPDCSEIPKSSNTDLKDASCIQDPSANPCKKSPAGVCLNEPVIEMAFKLDSVPGYKAPETKKEAPKTLPIQLNIQVPGLTLYDAYVDESEVIVPAIAQYIQAMQALLIGIGIIAAAIMIIYGGFLYIVSGSGAKVRDGKKIIIDALIGLVIIFGSYVILANINPNTANLSALHLYRVTEDYYTPVASRANESGPATRADELEIIEGAKMAGGDPCHVLAFCQHETGLRMVWNGWPRNPRDNAFSLGACSGDLKFIRDGSRNDRRLRAAFPGIWPPLGNERPLAAGERATVATMPEKGEVLLTNPRVDGFYAAISLGGRANILNEAYAGLGSANINRWRNANCPAGPYQNPTLAQAVAMGATAAINAACLPEAAALNGGCPLDNYNCSPVDPTKINTRTRGYEISPGGVIYGKCATGGARCITIWTHEHVRAAINGYKVFDAKYHCSSGGTRP